MVQMITAIFEDGIFKPLQVPDLTRHQVVSLVILMPRRREREGRLAVETKGTKPFLVSWKDWFATKLTWQKKGPLDLSDEHLGEDQLASERLTSHTPSDLRLDRSSSPCPCR